MNSNKRIYFVYKHFKGNEADDSNLFYVGRGKHNWRGASYKTIRFRAYSVHGRNELWNKIYNKYGFTPQIFVDNLTFEEASNLERELVAKYGRIDLRTGPLCNMCEGGEGTIDRVTNPMTLQDHIDQNVAFIPITGCWLWLGSVKGKHPQIHINSQSHPTGRYLLTSIKGKKVCSRTQVLQQSCGILECVNPDHQIISKRKGPATPKKITEEDIEDASKLLKYFYPSEISHIFPHISPNTFHSLAKKLKATERRLSKPIYIDAHITNNSISHLNMEDIINIKRLYNFGVSTPRLAILYNLIRIKIFGIINGSRGKLIIKQFNE